MPFQWSLICYIVVKLLLLWISAELLKHLNQFLKLWLIVWLSCLVCWSCKLHWFCVLMDWGPFYSGDVPRICGDLSICDIFWLQTANLCLYVKITFSVSGQYCQWDLSDQLSCPPLIHVSRKVVSWGFYKKCRPTTCHFMLLAYTSVFQMRGQLPTKSIVLP